MVVQLPQPDEEISLRTFNIPEQHRRKQPSIPWAQFSLLLVLQLAEPLSSQVIYPFAPELIRNLDITHGDETRIPYYVGLMQSLFFVTEALTILHWSRLSDYIGRKPVIMTGLMGLSLSMYAFGLSRTFWALVVSRCLNGALNGNIGVIKSSLAEITDSTNMAQASAYMAVPWVLGSIIGPIIGGSLSRPADHFPSVFGQSSFMKEYPYFLACSIPATFSAILGLLTLFILKETVRDPISIKVLLFPSSPQETPPEQCTSLLPEATAARDVPDDNGSRPLPLRRLLVPNVIIAAVNYGFLAIINLAFRAIQPVFYSTPIALGGLGLNPQTIGRILSVSGVVDGVLQALVFRRVHDRFGPKNVFVASVASVIPAFAMFPVINALARQSQGMSSAVWALVVVQVVATLVAHFGYACVFIFITASAPNRASLGTVTGMAQTVVSIMRMIAPAMANSLFSLSIDQEHHYMNGLFVYHVLVVLTCVALRVAMLLPAQPTLHWESEEGRSS